MNTWKTWAWRLYLVGCVAIPVMTGLFNESRSQCHWTTRDHVANAFAIVGYALVACAVYSQRLDQAQRPDFLSKAWAASLALGGLMLWIAGADVIRAW